MTVSTNTSLPKTITKIVTFYSDGTFSEYTPSPTLPAQPYTVPYPWPQPWWQGGPTSTVECKSE